MPFQIDKDMRQKFSKTVKAMRDRLCQRPNNTILRKEIVKRGLGKFNLSRKLSEKDLSKIVEKGGVVGVDGSTNSGGGVFPYRVTLQHSLAEACHIRDKAIRLTDVFSPLLLPEPMKEEDYREFAKENLAQLEVTTALMALQEFRPKVLLMDGSLVRFKIEAQNLWDNLVSKATTMDCLLIGVVEGISTEILSSNLRSSLPEEMAYCYDWEILFGLLEIGEVLEMVPGLFKEGFRTCFIRTSLDPKPIGLDLLEEQQHLLRDAENLVYSLCPKDGRGIPLWLDIIDRKVRITDEMVDEMLRAYLGDDYMHFLTPKRRERNF